jgi:energy-coupling factor transport system permease protein
MRISQAIRAQQLLLVENSPLRKLDPRTKLLMSGAVSFAVMLPLERLALFIAGYSLFLLWARLLVPAARQVWRMKWILVFLFLLDWWLIGLSHALTICSRLALLAGVFTLFFSTTNTRELGLALESLGVPYRYAFSLSLAFQSLGYFDDEWRAIREAQLSRGVFKDPTSLARIFRQAGDWVALTIPAIVLTTRRAWANTEAAYSRGFDSPKRKSYYSLKFGWADVFYILFTMAVLIALFWR